MAELSPTTSTSLRKALEVVEGQPEYPRPREVSPPGPFERPKHLEGSPQLSPALRSSDSAARAANATVAARTTAQAARAKGMQHTHARSPATSIGSESSEEPAQRFKTFAQQGEVEDDAPSDPVEGWGSNKRVEQWELRQAATRTDLMLQAQFDIVRGRNVEVAYEKKAWFVINPQRSNKFAAWQVVTILALGWVVIIVPFQVGLMEPEWGLLLLLSTIVDVIFFIDVLLQFITMYPRPTQSGVIWEQKFSRISSHYVKTWFALDALTLIPFDLIDLVFVAGDGGGAFTEFNATKIFRALRLLKLMRILKTSRWLHRVEITISLPYQQFALFRFLCILLLVCHWLACIWALTLQLADPLKPRWIDYIQDIDKEWNITTIDSPIRTYISSLYFCTYTMTSVGYGDIGPKTLANLDPILWPIFANFIKFR